MRPKSDVKDCQNINVETPIRGASDSVEKTDVFASKTDVCEANLTPIRGGIVKGKVASLRGRFDDIEKEKLLDLKRLKKSSLTKNTTPNSKQKKKGGRKPKIIEKLDRNQSLIMDYYRSQGGAGARGGSPEDV